MLGYVGHYQVDKDLELSFVAVALVGGCTALGRRLGTGSKNALSGTIVDYQFVFFSFSFELSIQGKTSFTFIWSVSYLVPTFMKVCVVFVNIFWSHRVKRVGEFLY